MFAERCLELFEWHGDDINTDEHIVAEVANVAVQYYKLGCLWSYLNHFDLIDRNYNNILIKKILEIEPQMINRCQYKHQVCMEHHKRSLKTFFIVFAICARESCAAGCHMLTRKD